MIAILSQTTAKALDGSVRMTKEMLLEQGRIKLFGRL
jgi:hypothetical protein